MRRSVLPVGLLTLAASPAFAQTLVQYDTISEQAEAAVSCGFCATEKFGTIFYELPGGGGLPASAFPLTLDTVRVAVASTVVGDILSGYMCSGSTQGGMVSPILEVYAGVNVPATITSLPATGAWPGEVVVVPPGSVQLQLSTDTAPGANQFNVMENSLSVGGVTVSAPYTYLRVVFTISAGGSSGACTDLGLQPPAMTPFRDDNGRVGPRRNFIYQLGLPAPFNTPSQWTWSEDVSDPVTGNMGINGDWLIRLEVTSMGGGSPDAGTTTPDGGMVEADAGAPSDDAGQVANDAGVEPDPDAGVIADAGVEPPPDAGTSTTAAPPPIVANISPDQTMEGAGVRVTVVGENFAPGVTMKVGAISAEVQLLSGRTTFVADVPAGIAAGVYDVLVSNPDGQTAIVDDGFEVVGDTATVPGPAPTTCVSVDPRSGGLWLLVVLGVWGWRRR